MLQWWQILEGIGVALATLATPGYAHGLLLLTAKPMLGRSLFFLLNNRFSSFVVGCWLVSFLGYLSTILRTAYRKQFYPKPMVPMESRDSAAVPFASLESLWPGIWQVLAPWRVTKSGHLTITKTEKLHINTRGKTPWFQKCYSFRSRTKNNEVIAEKPFQNSGVTRRLWTFAVLNWRSSSIHPSSYCY